MKVNKRAIINGIVAGLAIIVIIGFAIKPKTDNETSTNNRGQVSIGGDFSLIDHNGVRRGKDDFKNNYMLVYFGYSFCPDVCPLDLQKITMALSTLEGEGVDLSSLQTLFITIDPERDTPEVMNEYLKNFHPSILGLSGSVDEVKQAAQAYRVYYNKGEVQVDGTYLMDHSSIIYLMNGEGNYAKHFSPEQAPNEIADGIKHILDND